MVLVLGIASDFVSAHLRHARPAWHATGLFYVGVPALLLISLRMTSHGAVAIIGLFLVVWCTDTGALIAGNLIKGPRLAPALSPKKTWSGTIGGVVLACAVAAAVTAWFGGRVASAAALALLLSVIAHGGDLFESWVKRQFKFKDSGGLIPGHGGVLDRIDSTLAAAVAMAIAVFGLGLDASFGVQV
ncbi:MAG: phosphatidate cytidylyltransferase [Alphaproteobacteria bacterium]|nr:phosphatidate cytidylyltransferase [Alphaproteobacteria bacterium]